MIGGSSFQKAAASRRRFQYCKVVVATSLVWILLDSFILLYFSDCNVPVNDCKDNSKSHRSMRTTPTPGSEISQTTLEADRAADRDKELPPNLPKRFKRPDSNRTLRIIQNDLNSKLPSSNLPENKFDSDLNRIKKDIEDVPKDVGKPVNIPPQRDGGAGKEQLGPGPGDMGRPVIIPPEKEKEMKELFKINQFNLMASDMISVNRTLPDYRIQSCREKQYEIGSLPDTSIVIVFHNEAWSTLIRTIWSIINRSPLSLVKEIVLVDDASERDFLGKKLEDYVANLPVKVKVIRMGKRGGLIRARLKGVSLAEGKVITFLDAHCECSEGWLEPLLYEVHKNRTSVVSPVIDVISDATFEYILITDMIGGFNWKMVFDWIGVPLREIQRRTNDPTLPIRTPTMAGGLLSIDREYFYEVGSYDAGMDIWGGENLEMSFRLWQCGGQILISPCSHVAHVFRSTSPYTFPGGADYIVHHNTRRTVEVWLDKHKEFYYKTNPGALQINHGNVTDRIQLRKNLKCKSFRWYLENIFPESPFPLDFYSVGRIRNIKSGLCLDTKGRRAWEKIMLDNCFKSGESQMFTYSDKQKIMMDKNLCLDRDASGATIIVMCADTENQQWHFDRKALTLRHIRSNQCLEVTSQSPDSTPMLRFCNGSPFQQWFIEGLDLKEYNL